MGLLGGARWNRAGHAGLGHAGNAALALALAALVAGCSERDAKSAMGQMGGKLGGELGRRFGLGSGFGANLGRQGGALFGGQLFALLSPKEQALATSATTRALDDAGPSRTPSTSFGSWERGEGGGGGAARRPSPSGGPTTGARTSARPAVRTAERPVRPVTRKWESPENPGTEGSTTVVAESSGEGGETCRRAVTLVVRNGQEEREEATFCKTPGGAWGRQA